MEPAPPQPQHKGTTSSYSPAGFPPQQQHQHHKDTPHSQQNSQQKGGTFPSAYHQGWKAGASSSKGHEHVHQKQQPPVPPQPLLTGTSRYEDPLATRRAQILGLRAARAESAAEDGQNPSSAWDALQDEQTGTEEEGPLGSSSKGTTTTTQQHHHDKNSAPSSKRGGGCGEPSAGARAPCSFTPNPRMMHAQQQSTSKGSKKSSHSSGPTFLPAAQHSSGPRMHHEDGGMVASTTSTGPQQWGTQHAGPHMTNPQFGGSSASSSHSTERWDFQDQRRHPLTPSNPMGPGPTPNTSLEQEFLAQIAASTAADQRGRGGSLLRSPAALGILPPPAPSYGGGQQQAVVYGGGQQQQQLVEQHHRRAAEHADQQARFAAAQQRQHFAGQQFYSVQHPHPNNNNPHLFSPEGPGPGGVLSSTDSFSLSAPGGTAIPMMDENTQMTNPLMQQLLMIGGAALGGTPNGGTPWGGATQGVPPLGVPPLGVGCPPSGIGVPPLGVGGVGGPLMPPPLVPPPPLGGGLAFNPAGGSFQQLAGGSEPRGGWPLDPRSLAAGGLDPSFVAGFAAGMPGLVRSFGAGCTTAMPGIFFKINFNV